MGETSNFYEKCSSLSKKGDVKSLRTLDLMRGLNMIRQKFILI